MATVTIVLTDCEPKRDQVNVVVNYGDGGAEDDSPAHHMALAMVRGQFGGLTDEEEEGAGHG